MTNKEVLERLYLNLKRRESKTVRVTEQELRDAGFTGQMPTVMFKKFDNMWVRQAGVSYLIVQVEDHMLRKAEEVKGNENAPLPVGKQPKFNLKEMYKQKLKGNDKTE